MVHSYNSHHYRFYNFFLLMLSLSFFFGDLNATVLKREAYKWYDEEGRPRIFYKDDYHIALIHSEKKINLAPRRVETLRKFSPYFVLVNKSPSLTIYKTDRAIFDHNLFEQSSPVFAVSESSSPEMVLVGGVLISFKEEVGEKEKKIFIENEKLNVVKTIAYANDTVYYIHSPSGLASLQLAEKLRANDVIKTAVPNWGQPYILR